eukprot:COSAG02_NODE_2306_length_9174_cov_10.715152_3_plen_91_part_00
MIGATGSVRGKKEFEPNSLAPESEPLLGPHLSSREKGGSGPPQKIVLKLPLPRFNPPPRPKSWRIHVILQLLAVYYYYIEYRSRRYYLHT